MKKSNWLVFHKDHPMEVLGVNSGAEMATLCLARSLMRMGHKVYVCGYLKDGEREHQGMTFWDCGANYDVESVFRRARDIGPYHLVSAGRALPVYRSLHEENCKTRILVTQDRAGSDLGIKPEIVSRVVDGFVCVSNAQKDVFVQAGADASKCHVLYNGADFEIFKAGDPEKRDYRRMVFAGALVPDKGIHWLVESFAFLKSKYPEITLDVYGSSKLWGRGDFFDFKKVESQLPGLKFHGGVSQDVLARAYAEAGLCVVPSIWFDPFPLVAVEAQACGCPVLVADMGGLKEGVEDGVTGAVLRDVSQPALTQALDRLLSDVSGLKAMSKAALEKSRPKFTWEKFARGFVDIAETAMSKKDEAVSADSGYTTAKTPKTGVLSTWNQQCGLSTYAHYLFSHMPENTYVVFAEEAALRPGLKDGPNVERCWRRKGDDYSRLKAAVKRHGIEVLHLNCHYRFFEQPQFSSFLKEIRAAGVRVVAQLHNPYTVDAGLQALVTNVDKVLVHTPENRLEVIANGACPDIVEVLPHGVDVKERATAARKAELRKKLGIPLETKAVTSFGFIQPHKGMEGILEAVAILKQRGIDCRGYIVGRQMDEDPNSAEYVKKLQLAAEKLGIADRFTILNRFVDDAEVTEWLQAADVVLMNYSSQFYEASGACSLAVGAGAVVAASIAPPFVSFSDAVWHITSGYPVSIAVPALLTNDTLRETILKNAKEYCARNSWEQISGRLMTIYSKLLEMPSMSSVSQKIEASPDRKTSKGEKVMRVLVNNRPNMWTQAGGDTVLVQKTVEGLKKRGVDVVVDVEGKENAADYDVVHIVNFALPQMTRHYAERARAAGRPFVVTTLCEDIPSFHDQSVVASSSLIEYVAKGQDREFWKTARKYWQTVPGCQPFDNNWAAGNAAALLTNGSEESAVIRRTYPGAKNIVEVKLGFEVGTAADPGLFLKEYGIKDFILCVGRLETRKNQLMLLKALEDCELPVVLAAGGFSYQPQYEQAVRAFKRKGNTVILGRLSPEMLASAYAAAKVHALPSWYELPGLVSLEAAYHGCNVVVAENGTSPDYFGDYAFYCEPGNEKSILNAVLAAWNSPKKEGLREHIMKNTWDKTALETLSVYESVSGKKHMAAPATVERVMQPSQPAVPNLSAPLASAIANLTKQNIKAPEAVQPVSIPGGLSSQARLNTSAESAEELIAAAEKLAKAGNSAQAHEKLEKAEKLEPKSALMLRTRGAIYAAEGKYQEARNYFDRALAVNPLEPRALTGLGLCEMNSRNTRAAYDLFVKALKQEPDQMAALSQLIRCSYELNRFDELETALRAYVGRHSADNDMEFCLAGCLIKRDKQGEATGILKRVLTLNPEHKAAKELLEFVNRQKNEAPVRSSAELQAKSAPEKPADGTIPAFSSPQNVSAIQRLGELEEQKHRGFFDKVEKGVAEVLLRTDLKTDEKERALCLQAEVFAMKGETDKAQEGFEAVLKNNPDMVRAICGLGAIAAFKNDWTLARTEFKRALSINHEYDVALAGLGLCASKEGDLAGSWDCFHQAVKRNPENMRALMGLIEAGYPLKKLAEMEVAIRAYLEMHPADLEFIYSLAGCCYAQNKIQEAAEEVEKIILFKPDHKRALELREVISSKRAAALA